MLKPLPDTIREQLDATYGPPASGFADPRNITLNGGRVIWAPEVVEDRPDGTTFVKHPAGWVLPGGGRTLNRDLAAKVAMNIAALSTTH